MKIAKKSVFLMGLVLLSSTNIMPMFDKEVKNKEEMLKDLDELYDSISKKNITVKLLKETALWSLRSYIAENAKGNEKLLDTLNSVVVITGELVDKARTGQVSPVFATNYEMLQDNKKILENTTFQSEWFSSKKPKNDAKEVLLAAINHIEEIVTASDLYGDQPGITIGTYEQYK